MIPASGAGGPGFDPRLGPFLFGWELLYHGILILCSNKLCLIFGSHFCISSASLGRHNRYLRWLLAWGDAGHMRNKSSHLFCFLFVFLFVFLFEVLLQFLLL